VVSVKSASTPRCIKLYGVRRQSLEVLEFQHAHLVSLFLCGRDLVDRCPVSKLLFRPWAVKWMKHTMKNMKT